MGGCRLSDGEGQIIFLQNKWILLVFRLFLGAMFIYASWDKIANPEDFSGVIRNYYLLPEPATNFFAIILPWVELYIGICLILGIFVNGASLLSVGLMVMFLVALGQATARGLDIECGCFHGASKVGLKRILEDFLFLGMAYLVLKRGDKKWELFPKSVESG